jgi:hypothetical protein
MTHVARNPCALEKVARQIGVTPDRRENEHALFGLSVA